jgi:hypothetical protein
MTGTRTSASLAIAAAFGASALSGSLAMPVASADTLPNGLTVTCNPDSREGVDSGVQFNIGVQACRKTTTSADDCTPYANYTYAPPAKPARRRSPNR